MSATAQSKNLKPAMTTQSYASDLENAAANLAWRILVKEVNFAPDSENAALSLNLLKNSKSMKSLKLSKI